VSQWVGRASGLAEDFIANDGGSLELRLLVARQALAALASFKPSKDPAPFVAEAKQAAEALAQQSDDDLWQRRIQWELGQAYFYAVQIEHLRLQSAAALRYGQLAIENLAEGAETRQAVYDSEQLVGELYFQIGAVHAVHKQDHKTATGWYDKAVPLLTAPRPFSELLVPQREGEQLVSMGVSYWQTGEKDQALDLTLNGMELIQQAVDAGILPDSSLAVPYGNLATMYEQLGEAGDAAKFTELARSVAADRPSATGSTSQAPNAQNIYREPGRRPRTSANPGRQMSQASPSRRTTQNQPSGDPVRRSSQRHDGFLIK
jgi:tetratricopeptide (TPR) repeat protein